MACHREMLQRLCLAENIPLVNVIRKPEQEKLLNDIGATYVFDSSKGSFPSDLKDAVLEAQAYIAFDATGGERLACDVLTVMEQAWLAKGSQYGRSRSAQHKQVYIYGGARAIAHGSQ